MVHWTWLIVVWVVSVIGTVFVVSLCYVAGGADSHRSEVDEGSLFCDHEGKTFYTHPGDLKNDEHIGDAGQLT